jgi:hypothetical protein
METQIEDKESMIKAHKSVIAKLKAMRQTPRERIEEVIVRLMDIADLLKDEPSIWQKVAENKLKKLNQEQPKAPEAQIPEAG